MQGPVTAPAFRLKDDGACTVFDVTSATIRVRRSLCSGKEQAPKTAASVRDVEIPRKLAEVLAQFADNRNGYLFGNGKPLNDSTARAHLAKHNLPAFHAVRRFYVSHERAMAMSEEILRAQVGHSSDDITSRYSRFGTGADYEAQRRAEMNVVSSDSRFP